VNPLSTLVRKVGEVARREKAFYSPLDKAISEITQNKGTGEQMLAELLKTKGVAKELKDRPAIKAALQQPKVTKEQLQKAAAENPPAQIFEKVEKGPSDIKYKVEHDDLNNRYDVIDDYSNVVKSFRDYDDAEFYAGKLEGGTTKYEDYQVPGGKNYREIKLMLPSFRPSIKNMGRKEYNEAIEAADKMGIKDFQSSHFPESNILAHARVSDRVGPNGEKILHVEEIQSDWHQKGRKKGYQLPPEERGALEKKRLEIESYGVNATPEQKQEWADVMNKLQPETQHLKAPEAPFKQNWHELVMKRLLDDAVKKGYDKVVITPGAEQAKRYDLSKHFGELSYKHNEDGTVSIIGTDKKSGLANLHEEDIPQDKLSDYVGKELAEKIMANAGTPYEGNSRMRQGSMTLSNLDLKVGGEGMEGFYDKMLPSFLNDYGKKWGARVEPMKLPTPPKNSMDVQGYPLGEEYIQGQKTWGEFLAANPRAIEEFNTPVHSFTITPQMREEITQKGQPLYQFIPAGVGAGTLAETQEQIPEQPAPMKKGGKVKKVTMDSMRLALMDKQLRKHHG
jgi:hypothetical protein